MNKTSQHKICETDKWYIIQQIMKKVSVIIQLMILGGSLNEKKHYSYSGGKLVILLLELKMKPNYELWQDLGGGHWVVTF